MIGTFQAMKFPAPVTFEHHAPDNLFSGLKQYSISFEANGVDLIECCLGNAAKWPKNVASH